MRRDFCQFCGYREDVDRNRQRSGSGLGEKGESSAVLEETRRTRRCAVCGVPITPDMLKSGEARLQNGRYYCKLHAEQRERALKAILSSAYPQRRWFSSFNTRTIGTALAVIVMVISGFSLRTARSELLSSPDSSREAAVTQPVVSLHKIHLDGIRKIGAGLHKAIVKGVVTAKGASVRSVVIVVRLAFDGEELTGKTVVSDVGAGQSVWWDVPIILTSEQAERLRRSEPAVTAEVRSVE